VRFHFTLNTLIICIIYIVGKTGCYITDHSRMENVLEKTSVTESMLTIWLQANQEYLAARKLTYG